MSLIQQALTLTVFHPITDDADEEVQHPQTLSFSDDICLMDAATKGQVQDMQDLLRGGTSNCHTGYTSFMINIILDNPNVWQFN